MMKQLFSDNLFGDLDERYFKLVNRAADMKDEVDWELLNLDKVFDRYQSIFNAKKNIGNGSGLDSMTHFDFKCLLPALLQVEDRMSMAHGLEARVPLLDKTVVEFASNIPSNIKFPNGRLKDLLKVLAKKHLPEEVFDRRDKMGFPVPLREWYNGPLEDFIKDIFSSDKLKDRGFFRPDAILENFNSGSQFSRKTWGLLSLEIWHQSYHDKAHEYRKMRDMKEIMTPQIQS